MKRVDEVKTLGFYLLTATPNQGSGVYPAAMAAEAQLANVPALQKISVKFDIADCGSAEGVACQRGVGRRHAVARHAVLRSADPANDCVAKEFNLFDSGALIGQDKMEELLNGMTISEPEVHRGQPGPPRSPAPRATRATAAS